MFRCMEYTFHIQNFWSICMRLPWKTELSRYFSLYLNMYFLSFRIFEQLALALKNRNAPKCFAGWNVLLTFRMFEQFAWACPEKQSCPEIFHCIWTGIFYHSGFLSNFVLAMNRVGLEFFTELNILFTLRSFEQLALYRIHIFYYSKVLSNLRLPWKTELPWYFSLYWIYVIHSGVSSNLRFPWKTELPRNFSLYEI